MAISAILFRVCTLAFFLAEMVRADGSQCRPNGEYSTAINRLRNDILCSYDVFVRPVRQYNDTVDVKVRLSLRRIQFDERRDSLEVHSFFLMNWIDYHFVWEPAKYDNIDNLHVASNTIWIPDIGVFTSADETSFSLYKPPTICIIYNDGVVVCAPASTHTASCSADLTHWPYDRHTCNLVMGSWTHTGEKVNVSLMERSVSMQFTDRNTDSQP
ncbi:Neuronal acetylcholine receptor subunit alpha-2 [Zootermopsis nevadensis]|uniref:Neuronal acetylcholine receptor subunit alpha-2 n=1 Tax=Zootermopsis nevadensis TaxID=136037 RepID=A0A067R3K3_ZOONE|nr:Neuronal acetylcholine receptor subunit alpha-2 [Zootermopsis nevadensis]